MKKSTTLLALFILVSFSCRKNIDYTENCGCNGPETELVENIFGIITETDDGFEILTDTKGLLLPCAELPAVFKKEAQPVEVSGMLKVPCKKIPYDVDITPIAITGLKLRSAAYNKTDISLTIIKSEDYGYSTGFGYMVEDHVSGFKILQPFIPAVSGIVPFTTATHAEKTAVLSIHLLRKSPGLPSLSLEILKYMHVIN